MFFKPKSYLGIDIGAGGIKLVELKKEKKRPVLVTYGYTIDKHNIHSLSSGEINGLGANSLTRGMGRNSVLKKEDEQKMTDAEKAAKQKQMAEEQKEVEYYASKIKELHKASKAVSKNTVASLPVSSLFHAVITLPLTQSKEELEKYVRAEVQKFVRGGVNEVILEYEVVFKNEKQKIQQVLINAVPKKVVSFYSRVFQRAGLTLLDLESESAALARSLVGRDQAVSVLVDMGAERTNLFIIDRSTPITHQSIDFGGNKVDRILQNILGVEEEEIGQIKYDLFHYLTERNKTPLTPDKFLEMFTSVLDPIIKEMELSFEIFLRQPGNETKRVEKVILTGGMAAMPFLTDYISGKFNLKCYVGDPWARVVYQNSLKPLLHEIGPRMSIAIGLALRNVV